MDIVSSDDHDDIDDLDEDQDISFITSEHVTLTEELQENQEKAVKVKELKRYISYIHHMFFQKIQEILLLLGCNKIENDLLKALSCLKGEVEKVITCNSETDEESLKDDSIELLDLEGITDEKQVLEVSRST